MDGSVYITRTPNNDIMPCDLKQRQGGRKSDQKQQENWDKDVVKTRKEGGHRKDVIGMTRVKLEKKKVYRVGHDL